MSSPTQLHSGFTRVHGVVAVAFLIGLVSCSSGGGGGASNGFPGQEQAKPGGGSFFVDPNQGGQASRLLLAEMFWARLVDIHDVDAQGRTNLTPVFRDFAIGENIQSDNSTYRLETNPITQQTRLVILRTRGAPDLGLGTFDSLLRRAASSLPPVLPRNDDGSTGDQYSFVARNATLILRFNDVLTDDFEALTDLSETVRVLAGYPPVTPYSARLLFDPNHGAIVGDEFHSTRVIVDLTISETEIPSMAIPRPVNAVGLPESLTTTTAPNVSLRIPTQAAFGQGQFKLLRGLSGVPLTPFNNGPVDISSPTRDVVRACRSGKSGDQNNGFLLDLGSPQIVGGWATRIDAALQDPAGQVGFDYLLDLTFTTICRGAPEVGDVISIGEVFFEVVSPSAAPDVDGEVLGVKARSLAANPLDSSVVLVGNSLFLSTFQASDPVPSGCWVSFTPQPTVLPTTGVASEARALVRFSEPMDPTSLSPFDNLFMVRGDVNTVVDANNLIVGELEVSSDLKEYSFRPRLPLPHVVNAAETYHLRVEGPTDLAGNSLLSALPPINFEMAPSQPTVENGGTVLRFKSVDEVKPTGLNDLRGQFFFDFERELIRPRPVAFTSYPADRTNPVPSIMIPFGPGVQTPLSPLGSKLQTVWRYCDLAWQVLDETKYNMDVVGLAWAPRAGGVINDFFENFEIRLAHSRRLPDESIDQNLLPKWEPSGLVGRNIQFTANILVDPLSPQKIVHPRSLGYRINGADLFLSSSGTVMLPFPLNRGATETTTYTWRDTAVTAVGGPNNAGIPMDIESGGPLNLENFDGYVAETNEVPSFGLPLLMEYRCYPSNTGLGLNAVDISLAINSSAIPSFRVYSTGGIDEAGNAVRRDPDEELFPRGGFNPTSTPSPGKPTARVDDNAFYIGQLDTVTRISRVHTVWINSGFGDPDYQVPEVLPLNSDQPDGTEVVVEYRGAEGFILSDQVALGAADESTFPFDSRRLNAYGEIFALFPETRPAGMVSVHRRLGSDEFPGEVQFLNGDSTWLDSIHDIDGARYFQMRFTFVGNITTLLNPELSAIGIAYSPL